MGGVQRDVLGFGAGVLQVNGAAFDLQGPGAVDAAPRTVQARRAELQPRGVAGDAARPVVELARQGQAQLAAAGLLEPPALVVQRVRAQAQRPGIEPGAFGAQALRGAHLQGAWHHYLGLAQVQRAAAGVVAGVGGTGVHAREVQRPRADAAVSARAQVSVQGGVARAANLQLALPGGGLALGVHACEQRRAGTGADVALRADAGVAAGLQGAAGAEPAVAGEHQIARRGGDEAGVVHAQPGFGAHQEDLAGVHAPQGRHVQRKLRALVGALHGAQHARRARAGARHIVGTREYAQLFGPQARVDLHGARQDGGVAGRAAVQPQALHDHAAPAHLVRLQVARAQNGRAGAQGDAAGVDEAPAVDYDARRVGHDDFGALARHFHHAVELAGRAGVHFVEDDARAARGQPGVALHVAAKLGGAVGAAVVEDGALGVHIKLAVGVVAQAGRVGGLDVDLWCAVGAAQHRGLLRAGGALVGPDLGRGRRGAPQQRAEQCRQAGAGGVAKAVKVRTHGKRAPAMPASQRRRARRKGVNQLTKGGPARGALKHRCSGAGNTRAGRFIGGGASLGSALQSPRALCSV